MRKLLLLELIFLVTAVAIGALLSNTDNYIYATFFLSAFFGFVVSWYENKDKKLGKGALLGLISGFLWGAISVGVMALFMLSQITDLLFDESRLVAQLNFLKLSSFSNVFTLTQGGMLVLGIVMIGLVTMVIGSVFGLIASVVLTYLKGTKSKK